ncbi:MAG: AAA family ATPase [Xenococcaceae cyanobacterium]
MSTQTLRVLNSLNQVRDEFRKHCPFPLVFWVNDEIVKKLIRSVPDFESWATLAEFSLSKDELVDTLQQRAERLFSKVLDAGANHFLANEDIFGRHYRLELELALRDLDNFDQKLPADLEACWQFVRGRDAYASDQIDDALTHYQQSFDFWQQTNHQLRQGALLFHIGLCYCRKAELHRFLPKSQSRSHWQKASSYFQQCVDVFEQVQRSDLVAKFINQRGEVLGQLGDWEKLSDLAQKSMELHEKHGKSLKEQDRLSLLAQDHGFLAEVALKHKNWYKAKKQAEKAREIIETASEEQRSRQGLYLLLLARSQRQQKQVQDALESLKQAKEREPQDRRQAQVYIEILEELRSLYFEQNEYLKAFLIKKERRSIEQQFGFRAFIGAGRLKPRQLLGRTQQQVTVADEIASSCRRQYVDQLIERIGSTYQKLTVIYGPSGVGKSSMVEAGLVPRLKQKPIGERDIVPILLRDYSSWVTELGQLLVKALQNTAVKTNKSVECDELKVILDQVQPKEQLQPSETKNLLTEISKQLTQNANRNLLTVLIFDQFEEFFLICKEEEERKRFTEFFRDCLNIDRLKIILSLREDYLHLLLQGSRQVTLDAINNNILDKNNLYYVAKIKIGNIVLKI